MMPFFASIAAWALLAAMSCRYRWRSKSIEALISSMIGSGPDPKRPPHILLLMMRSLPRFFRHDRAVCRAVLQGAPPSRDRHRGLVRNRGRSRAGGGIRDGGPARQ